MASVSEPRGSLASAPVSRPAAPHLGLEADLTPLDEEAAPPRSRLAWLTRFQQWAIWRIAFIVACGLAFCCTAALYVGSLTDNLSVEGDNAIYIILAKALAIGQGYTNIQGPTPRIEAQFPFVFPVLLAPVVRIFGVGGIWQMQFLVTLFALGSFVLSFFLFRRWLGSAVLAIAIVLATAASDLVWEFSHKVLTEIPYMFFTLLACWWATRYAGQERWRTWAGALAAIAAATAFLTRTIGLGICVAVPLYLLLAPPLQLRGIDWRLRLKKAGLSTGILLLLAGGWTLRNRIVFSGQGHNYIGQFFLKQAYVPDAGRVSGNGLLERAANNISYYATMYQRMVGGHIWDHVPARGNLSQGLLAITLIGFLYALLRRRTLAEFYMAGYVGIVLLWPWQDLRFAVPVFPFLIYYLAQALQLLMLVPARLRNFDPRVAAAMVLVPLAAPTGIHTLHTAMLDRQVGFHYEIERLGEWRAYSDWQDFHAAALWLKANAVPGSTVINRSPNLLYLWTGLASRNYPYSFDKYSVLQDIGQEHNDYVIDDSFTWTYTTGLYLEPVIHRYTDYFVPVYKIHGTTVYQVVSP